MRVASIFESVFMKVPHDLGFLNKGLLIDPFLEPCTPLKKPYRNPTKGP